MLSELCLALSLGCAFSRSYKRCKVPLPTGTSATTVKKGLSFPTGKAKVPSLRRQESLPVLGWVGEWGVRSSPREAQGLWEKEPWFIIKKSKCHQGWGTLMGGPEKSGRGLHCHQQCLSGLLPPNSQLQFFLFNRWKGRPVLFCINYFYMFIGHCNSSFVTCSFKKLEPSPVRVSSAAQEAARPFTVATPPGSGRLQMQSQIHSRSCSPRCLSVFVFGYFSSCLLKFWENTPLSLQLKLY